MNPYYKFERSQIQYTLLRYFILMKLQHRRLMNLSTWVVLLEIYEICPEKKKSVDKIIHLIEETY